MHLIVNNKIIDDIIKPLNIQFEHVKEIKLNGYKICFDEKNRFYLETSRDESVDAKIISVTNNGVYKLDAFESAIDFKKLEVLEKDTYSYFKVSKNSSSDILSLEDINSNFASNMGMNHCDLNLLIPCKTKKGITDKDFITYNHELSLLRANGFAKIIKEEFGNEYFKKIVRYLLGEVNVIIKDEGFNARGFLEIAYHQDVKICVLEIYIPNVTFGANKILSNYLSDKLIFKHKNVESNDINDLLERLELRPFGRRRSMVFCDNNVTKREIINTLANEEIPMGKIGGTFLENVNNENIAIYDTAEVYVSRSTMIEVEKDFVENYYVRYEYEVLETFFVELILMQDAAMDKIYKNLLSAQDSEITTKGNNSGVIDEISFDMSKATRFADFESINFPTVRESAYKIAKKFGIDSVYEKYEENKSILQDMIAVNRREIERQENEIKNNFLFLISAISLFGMISGIVDNFINNVKISYILSLVAISLAYILYRYLLKKNSGADSKNEQTTGANNEEN